MNHATRQATLHAELLGSQPGTSLGTEPDFPKGRTDVGLLALPEAEEHTQRMEEDLLQAIREDAHLQRRLQKAPAGTDLSSLLAEPLRGTSIDGDWGIEGWSESDENARLSSELDKLLQSSLFPNDHSTQFRSKAAEEPLPSAQWLRKSTPLLHGRPARASTGGAGAKPATSSEEPVARKEPRGGPRAGWSKVPSTTEMSRQIALDALRQHPNSTQPKPKGAAATGEPLLAPKPSGVRPRVAESLGDPSLLVEEVRPSSQPPEEDTSQFSPNEIHAILSLAPEQDDEAEVFQSPAPTSPHEDVTRDVTRSARQVSARQKFKEADETTRRVSLRARKQEKKEGRAEEAKAPPLAPTPAPVASAPAPTEAARALLRAPQARAEGRAAPKPAPTAAPAVPISSPISSAHTGELRAIARAHENSATGEVGWVGLKGLDVPTTAKLYRAPQQDLGVRSEAQVAARGVAPAGWGWQRVLGAAVGMAMILSSSIPLAQVSGAWPWSPVIALIPIVCGAVFILSHALGVAQMFQRMVFVVFGGLFLAFCATPAFFHLLGAFHAWGAGVPQLALVLLLVGAAPRDARPALAHP